MIFKTALRDLFESEGFFLSDSQIENFFHYRNMIVYWNKKMNLTTIIDDEGMIERHMFDSVTLLRDCDIPFESSLVDVGAGAGFPSIPIKILRPDIEILMIDSLNKRVSFLDTVIEELGLQGISAMHIRAEDAGHIPELRESFDFATARALTRMRELSELLLPLIKIGGQMLAMKGQDTAEELEEALPAIAEMGAKFAYSREFSLPSGDKRQIIAVEKTGRTPDKYPRTEKKMKAKPII